MTVTQFTSLNCKWKISSQLPLKWKPYSLPFVFLKILVSVKKHHNGHLFIVSSVRENYKQYSYTSECVKSFLPVMLPAYQYLCLKTDMILEVGWRWLLDRQCRIILWVDVLHRPFVLSLLLLIANCWLPHSHLTSVFWSASIYGIITGLCHHARRLAFQNV